MYGGGFSKGRGESKQGKRHGMSHGGASKHQVGTSQSGSGPWAKHKGSGFWTGKIGLAAMGNKFHKMNMGRNVDWIAGDPDEGA